MDSSDTTVAVVWGAGGIGSAMAAELVRQKKYSEVVLVSRDGRPHANIDVVAVAADLLIETSIVQAKSIIAGLGDISLLIVATGVLHAENLAPEKSLRQLSTDTMRRVFDINTIGPALIAKHFLPVMARKERAVFAAVSARVGSISDNRLGGWYSYRASKTALNMLLKTLSIEWKRSNPLSICVGLHPGTVNTALSQPFQRGVAPEKLFSPSTSAEKLVSVLDRLSADDSGKVFAFDGAVVPE